MITKKVIYKFVLIQHYINLKHIVHKSAIDKRYNVHISTSELLLDSQIALLLNTSKIHLHIYIYVCKHIYIYIYVS